MSSLTYQCMLPILIILVATTTAQQANKTAIYGMRWFLGDHFTYSIDDSPDNNELFVLAFNSDSLLQGETSVMINKNRFTCTANCISTVNETIHHPEVENFTNDVGDDIVDKACIYKCVLGDIRTIMGNRNIKAVNYSIVSDNVFITQSTNPTVDKYSHLSLYNGTFRLPYYELSFQALVIGDWGQIRETGRKKGFVDPLPCLLKKLEDHKNIVMVVFTGDLAYDLQGGKYYSMLKYMEPLTSQVTLVAAPGNHDTLYHADTFYLFTETYYSPQWWTYSNYFNKFSIGKIFFLFYNPELEEFDFTRADRLKKNFTSVFEQELTPSIISSIKSSYFPIVVSHYPIYCSDTNDDAQSCQKNIDRFKAYREYFMKMDMKLYLSGHLHVYERTAPICYNETFYQVNPDNYNMSCPVYIIEGAGGNDFYVQMQTEYPQQNFSSSIVFNTGFGILTINSASENSYPDQVLYEHISAGNCSAADHFKMSNTLVNQNINTNNNSNSNSLYLWRILVKIAVLAITISVIIKVALFLRRKYKKSGPLIKTENQIPHQQNHVEMVEENFDAPQSDKPEHTTQ